MQQPKIIIMLSGKAGAGKDTFADYLCSNFGFVKYSLAEPMREACAANFQLPLHYFTDRQYKDVKLSELKNASPRDLLIAYAAEKRKEDVNFFTKLCANKLHQEKIVIADCRKVYEITYMQQRFAQVVCIFVQREANPLNILDNAELQASDCDAIVQNQGTQFDGAAILAQLPANLLGIL